MMLERNIGNASLSKPGDPAFGDGFLDYWAINWHDPEVDGCYMFQVQADDQFDLAISGPGPNFEDDRRGEQFKTVTWLLV